MVVNCVSYGRYVKEIKVDVKVKLITDVLSFGPSSVKCDNEVKMLCCVDSVLSIEVQVKIVDF